MIRARRDVNMAWVLRVEGLETVEPQNVSCVF